MNLEFLNGIADWITTHPTEVLFILIIVDLIYQQLRGRATDAIVQTFKAAEKVKGMTDNQKLEVAVTYFFNFGFMSKLQAFRVPAKALIQWVYNWIKPKAIPIKNQ